MIGKIFVGEAETQYFVAVELMLCSHMECVPLYWVENKQIFCALADADSTVRLSAYTIDSMLSDIAKADLVPLI